jgi:hypothetical protein
LINVLFERKECTLKARLIVLLLLGTLSLGSLVGGVATTVTGSSMALKKMGPGTVVLKKMGPGTLTFLPQSHIIFPYQ